MIVKLLLNTRIIGMIFIKTLKIIIQIKSDKYFRGKKLNIALAFITQSYFAVPKNIRLNSTHYSLMKIPNKSELQQIAVIIHQILTFKTL